MAKRILIDAQVAGETRVAVVDNDNLIDFDSEIASKKPIKGNIYLARVVRIEPSLQSVFIEYGNEKNGFLPFNEIHPDYYRIPVEDREDLDAEGIMEPNVPEEARLDLGAEDIYAYPESVVTTIEKGKQEQPHPHPKKTRRRYNVQEVIQHKQILLVQCIKDERGNKGAAFTTYLSLPGQYCVLMPNAGNRLGGISKRVIEDSTRQRLKDILQSLNIPDKMAVIIRTAGQERSKMEIRRDYEYLLRVWDNIRQKTLESIAPVLIHEEGDILMRSIRDFYTKEVSEILVNEPNACKNTKTFMKQLSPSSAKKVKQYKEESTSLFNAYNIENQILSLISPSVDLPSGGSIVIGQTEALVAIDVNSGKANKERHIDTTAFKTNIEAAHEIARQIRLRDLSGLIVIDFIDMTDSKAIQQVEKCFREAVSADRARIQISSLSQFCLLELSRQRLRSSVMETYSEVCPHCQGRGRMYSKQYILTTILHMIEKKAMEHVPHIKVFTPLGIYGALLNTKRKDLCNLEERYNPCHIQIEVNPALSDHDFVIENEKGAPSLFSIGKIDSESEDVHDHVTWAAVPQKNKHEKFKVKGKPAPVKNTQYDKSMPKPAVQEPVVVFQEKEINAENPEDLLPSVENANNAPKKSPRRRRNHKRPNGHKAPNGENASENFEGVVQTPEPLVNTLPEHPVSPAQETPKDTVEGVAGALDQQQAKKRRRRPKKRVDNNMNAEYEAVAIPSVPAPSLTPEQPQKSDNKMKNRRRPRKRPNNNNGSATPESVAHQPTPTPELSQKTENRAKNWTRPTKRPDMENKEVAPKSEAASIATPQAAEPSQNAKPRPAAKKGWLKKIFNSEDNT